MNPYEENRGEEEHVDYHRIYNQKHIIEKKVDDSDDDNNKSICDLESVDENDLYHYHFGDYYESMSDIEIQKEVMGNIRQQQVTFEFENDIIENRKRVYESEEDEYNDREEENYDDEEENLFTQFGDIFTFTLRTNPETKEKCFDTIKYFLYSSFYH